MVDIKELNKKYEPMEPQEILKWSILHQFRGSIALSSSFGIGSAVLLHMVSKIDKGLKIIFIDTGCHFKETIEYKDRLVSLLGLTNIVKYAPTTKGLDQKHHDLCCAIRKIEPIKRSLEGFSAWISGIMRSQSETRKDVHMVESYERDIYKINPLVNWTSKDSYIYMKKEGLPHHPLFEKGYPSVGCKPCTFLPTAEGDERSGRWKDTSKTECGLHTFMDKK